MVVSPDESTQDPSNAPNGWPNELLRGFRDGARPALTEVYRTHAPGIARFLRRGFVFTAGDRTHRFVGYASAFDFHDALHETFRRAFEPAARLRYDGIRPYEPYLRAIARNVVLRTFRAHERLFPEVDAVVQPGGPVAWVVEEPAVTQPEHVIATEQIRALVRRFLSSLGPDDQKLVQLRFVDGFSQRDVAERLGIGRQRVRTREAALRRALLRHLRTHDVDPGAVLVWPVMVVLQRLVGEVLS